MQKRQNPIPFDLPSDLWAEFEARGGTLPRLKLILDDLIQDPRPLVKATVTVLTRETLRSQDIIVKGVRWPEQTWDGIRLLARKLHTSQVGIIRMAIESSLLQPDHQ